MLFDNRMKNMNIYKVIREKGNVIVEIMFNRSTGCYQFVNLTKGHICSCQFNTVDEAINDMQKKKDNGEIIDFIRMNNYYE